MRNSIERPYASSRCLSLMLLAAMAATTAMAATSDWPQYRGPNHDGIAPESGWLRDWPAEGPAQLWSKSLGVGFASMTVKDGTVYAAGHKDGQDHIYSLNADTGETNWTFSYDAQVFDRQHEGGPCGTPVTDGERVYSMSKWGELYCLDVSDGSQVWMKDLTQEVDAQVPTWGFSGSATLEGDILLIDVGRILAMNKLTGDIVWQTQDYGSAYSTPIPFMLGERACVAAFPEHGLVILDLATGEELGKHRWETSYGVNACAPLIVGDGLVFIASGYNVGGALLRVFEDKDPEVVWQNKHLRNQFNTSVLYEGYLYGIDDDQLACVHVKTGERAWVRQGSGKGSLTLADGTLIVLSDRGELILVNATHEGYQELARAHVLGGKCWTAPVMAGHRVYCRNAQGDLVCVDLRQESEAATSDTP